MRILVKLTVGNKSYIEDVTDDHENLSERNRPINISDESIDDYNGNHFIFGWFESFAQSDDVPPWISNAESISISVLHIEENDLNK